MVNSLDSFKEHKHLHPVHSTITVLIALYRSLPNLLVTGRRSHSHRETEVSIGIKEFLSFESARSVEIVSHEDVIDGVHELLIMMVSPSPGVINIAKSIHIHVSAVVSPSIEGMTMVSMMSVVSLMSKSS